MTVLCDPVVAKHSVPQTVLTGVPKRGQRECPKRHNLAWSLIRKKPGEHYCATADTAGAGTLPGEEVPGEGWVPGYWVLGTGYMGTGAPGTGPLATGLVDYWPLATGLIDYWPYGYRAKTTGPLATGPLVTGLTDTGLTDTGLNGFLCFIGFQESSISRV